MVRCMMVVVARDRWLNWLSLFTFCMGMIEIWSHTTHCHRNMPPFAWDPFLTSFTRRSAWVIRPRSVLFNLASTSPVSPHLCIDQHETQGNDDNKALQWARLFVAAYFPRFFHSRKNVEYSIHTFASSAACTLGAHGTVFSVPHLLPLNIFT